MPELIDDTLNTVSTYPWRAAIFGHVIGITGSPFDLHGHPCRRHQCELHHLQASPAASFGVQTPPPAPWSQAKAARRTIRPKQTIPAVSDGPLDRLGASYQRVSARSVHHSLSPAPRRRSRPRRAVVVNRPASMDALTMSEQAWPPVFATIRSDGQLA